MFLNMSNFKQLRTQKKGPMWRFTVSLVENRVVDGNVEPHVLMSVNGCLYAGAKIVRTPDGGGGKRGFFSIVDFCEEWLVQLKATLDADPEVQEYLKDVPEPVEYPPDPRAVPGIKLHTEVG